MGELLQGSPLKDITFKAIMVMSTLMLQKPSQKSKRDHLKALKRRLELWESDDIIELLKESETTQKNLTTTASNPSVNENS